MTTLERLARDHWRSSFPYRKFTRCSDCGEHRHCGAKRPRGRWLCIDCFDLR